MANELRTSTDIYNSVEKYMLLPIVGFKNTNYHTFVATDNFVNLMKNTKWDKETFMYFYGLRSTIKDLYNLPSKLSGDNDDKEIGTLHFLWKIYRSIEIISSTLRKLGYLRSIHFYGVQPAYGGFGFTEFKDTKINSFVSQDFHTVLNPYEYIMYYHPVHAVCDGEVVEIVNKYPDKPKYNTELKLDNFLPDSKVQDYMGNKIVIKNKNSSLCTVYANIKKDSFLPKVGDKVKRGEMICRVGCSGTFRTPCLLFYIRTGEVKLPGISAALQLPTNATRLWAPHWSCNLLDFEAHYGKQTVEFYKRFDTQKIKYVAGSTFLRDCSLVKQFPTILVE